MPKLFTLLVLVLLLRTTPSHAQYRGELLFDSIVASFGLKEILDVYDHFQISEYLIPIDFQEVEIHKIVYRTLDGRGENLTLASGLVTIPVNEPCQFPLLLYNHGSHMYDEVMSEFTAKFDQHLTGVPFSANGYITILPDYLGYGATPLEYPHPYIHAKSEATCTVDAIRAAKALCLQHDVELNGQLFLLGYSQGGHVTMATHRELQQFHPDEFTVTASAPCSGPYDLSGIIRDSILSSGIHSNPFFIAFTVLSYQYVYQNIYEEIGDVFKSPYDSLIVRMLNRYDPQSYLRDSLPFPGVQMFQPDFLSAILADSLHPLNVDIRDNDVYDWIPEAPVGLIYCTEDEQVPYENALFTADYMSALGADVQAFYAGPFNHVDCTFMALLGARNWFEFYREKCTIGAAGEWSEQESELQVFPNPNSGNFTVEIPAGINKTMDLQMVNMYGNVIFQDRILPHEAGKKLDLTVPASGIYILRTMADETQASVKIFVE